MKSKTKILEGDCDYLDEDATQEYDLPAMTPATDMQARFRAQAIRHAVQVDADILEFFKSPQAVNEALRYLMKERNSTA